MCSKGKRNVGKVTINIKLPWTDGRTPTQLQSTIISIFYCALPLTTAMRCAGASSSCIELLSAKLSRQPSSSASVQLTPHNPLSRAAHLALAPPFARAMHGRVARVTALLAAVLLASSAAAQPWRSCDGASGNYAAGSAYANNTQQLILGLQTNASASPTYFASGSVGAGTAAVVYGRMICRSRSSRWCNRTRDAALVYNQCYVRVAATNFLASPKNTGMVSVVGGATIPGGVDVAAYDAALRRLLNATAQYAVDSSSPPSSSSPRLYFAVGQLVGLDPRVPNIWSLAQCAGDLAPAQCRRCLDDLMALWWNGSGFKPDGASARFAGSRCNLRSDLGDKFYTNSPMVKLQMNGEVVVPAPAPSTAGERLFYSI